MKRQPLVQLKLFTVDVLDGLTIKTNSMLLKELREGQRFMFEDRKTPLAPAGVKGNYSAQGTFIYKGVGPDTCPRLLHEEQNLELTVVSSTYYRYVLIIL